MALRSEPAYVIRRTDQLRALRSPVRQEIVDAVIASGPRSVAEVAEILGRPADALYYHVRRLQRVGLLVTSGRRHTGARTEEVVDVPGRPLALTRSLNVASHRNEVRKIVAAMLRLTYRQYAAALRRRTGSPRPGVREEWASRVSGWLTPAERDGLMRTLLRMNDTIQSRRRGAGRRLHAFTFVVAPLAARSRRPPKRRKSAP